MLELLRRREADRTDLDAESVDGGPQGVEDLTGLTSMLSRSMAGHRVLRTWLLVYNVMSDFRVGLMYQFNIYLQ